MAPPPQLPQAETGGLPIQTLLPVLGAVSSMVMMTLSRGSSPVYLIVGSLVFVVALVSGVAMAFTTRARATRARKLGRERYLDYLEDLRFSMSDAARQARTVATRTHPEPGALEQVSADPARVWERRPNDEDFLCVRLGVGAVPWFGLTPPVDQDPVQPLDPLLLEEARRASQTCGVVEDMPIWADMAAAGDVAVIGDPEATSNLARAMISQIAVFHSADDVRIAAVFDPDHASQWLGIDQLPHAYSSTTATGVPRSLVTSSVDALVGMLSADLTARIRQVATRRHSGSDDATTHFSRLIVVLDEHGRPAQNFPIPEEGYSCTDLGITVVHLLDDRLDEPSEVDVRITLNDGQMLVEDLRIDDERRQQTGRPDRVDPALFEAISRDVAPLAMTSEVSGREQIQPDTVSAMTLLGIHDVDDISPENQWRPRTSRDFLRVPIGVDDYGAPLLLDLKESAQLGMGPHGICVGATGSGKSELLRTLVLSLALTHSPEDLSMILVDYKGGAAFAPFAHLAHVAGLIDNLADDPQLTRRARESIAGEVLRRQEMLKQANSAASISHYRAMRENDPSMAPMPHLFIVIDEFGELLTAEPEFSDLLIQIGRIGRSIGVHLLLASQRIETGMLRGLDTYLSYWIGMRTFSEAESRTILDTPDAFTLPDVPGYGYLKVSTSVYTRFRAGYVSAPAMIDVSPIDTSPIDPVQVVDMFDRPAPADLGVDEEEITPPDVGRLLVDEVVDRLETDMVTTPVWLPPLPARVTLGSVLTTAMVSEANGSMRTPIGLLDDPSKQQQTPWMLDLGAHGGHIAIVGAPQTGRSTFLRTIAASLALTHTPKQVSIYGIDLSGGGLDRIEGFPHVGGVATRMDRNRLSRMFEELHTMISQRENIVRDRHIDSVAALRQAHARGLVPELVAPDVVILIDGLEPIKNEFEELDQPLTELLQRGGTFGIHVVVALTRWNELRTTVQPLIGQHFELRLNDPVESSIQRAAASALKNSSPGRALTQELKYGQIALPILDDVDDDARVGEELALLAERSSRAWSGPAAAPIRLLPDHLDPGELPDEFDEPDNIPFGLRQDNFEPICFMPAADQHLLVIGDAECGKTTLLHGLVQQFIKRASPDELVFAAIDPRGTITASIPDDYRGGQASSSTQAQALCAAIAAELDKRLADKDSSWPRVVVLVDDYDIISAGGNRPLTPLLAYLPSARDLKLNIILTRPVSGASRGMLDPAIQAIHDTGGSGLVMSGDRSEGPIFPKVYAEQFPPGRGKFVRRGSFPRIVQVAEFSSEVSRV